MKQLVAANAQAWVDGKNQNYTFAIYRSGSRTFLEVTVGDNYYQSDKDVSFTVELCRDEMRVQVDDKFLGQSDLFRQMADMVKNAQGMWQPRFQPGDVVLVDHAGSSTVKVIDPLTQTSETLEKKQVIIDPTHCSCSLRTLMQLGCARQRGQPGCEI